MAADRELITAEDLDAMTPDQRAEAFDRSIVRDWDDIPPESQARIQATARRLAAERATA